jgi:hypothetical protein
MNKTSMQVLDDNYLYISHLDEGFQFWKLPMWPDAINDNMQSNFQPTNALGRTAPVYTFSNAGPRTVQVQIALHRDIMDDINIGISNSKLGEGEDYVDNLLRALQAIALPKYNLQNKAVEPPIVALRLGNEIFIKGIVSSAIGLEFKKPILSNGKYAQVTLSLQISEVDPYDSTTVYKNGGFRGVVQSLKKGMNLED